MNSWLQAMKQWTQWLMGDAPLPDGRSKAMLAGTVAAAAVVAVGLPAAIPSSPSANAAPKQRRTLLRAATDVRGGHARPRWRRPRSFSSGPPTTTTAAPSATVVRTPPDRQEGEAGQPRRARAPRRSTTTTVATDASTTAGPRSRRVPTDAVVTLRPHRSPWRRRTRSTASSPRADPAAGPAGHRGGGTGRLGAGHLEAPGGQLGHRLRRLRGRRPGPGVRTSRSTGPTPVVGHLVPGDRADARPDVLLHGPRPGVRRVVGPLQRGVDDPLRPLRPGRPPRRPGRSRWPRPPTAPATGWPPPSGALSVHGSATDLGSTGHAVPGGADRAGRR